MYRTARSPLTPLNKGGTRVFFKFPLIKGDLGGSRLRLKATFIVGSVLSCHQWQGRVYEMIGFSQIRSVKPSPRAILSNSKLFLYDCIISNQ
ncbi:MAG TPA: hypothetical protein DD001_18620 [Microcoleaceae bacterium UBA10368]|nr:hypothetical protein [Microcoleaceae cyanobacterium UBA10368]